MKPLFITPTPATPSVYTHMPMPAHHPFSAPLGLTHACHEQNKQENYQSRICQQPEFDSLELIPVSPAPATSHAISL